MSLPTISTAPWLDATGQWPFLFKPLAALFAEESGQEINLDYWSRMSAQLYLPPSFVILAVSEEGEPIGALGFLVHPGALTPGLEAQETFWYVHPSKRRGMLGPRMIRMGLKMLKGMGIETVRFSAFDEKVGAFLAKRGFKRTETTWVLSHGSSNGDSDSPGSGSLSSGGSDQRISTEESSSSCLRPSDLDANV